MLDSRDTWSSVLGWVSIANWIIVYSPQIYENYSLQSGEGLSILFVLAWLVGDLCNLFGAILGGLLPTVIILALYYSVCDLILLAQIYYYRWKRSRQLSRPLEQEPLLQTRHERPRNLPLLLRYTAALVFVVVVGVMAWWISSVLDARPTSPPTKIRWEAQVLGWTSAVLYLVARIPQISKNLKTHCEGLSPALFFFAIFGNVTFSLSIGAQGLTRKNLIANSGWLAGSALTVFLDVFVLGQVFYYRAVDRSSGRSR